MGPLSATHFIFRKLLQMVNSTLVHAHKMSCGLDSKGLTTTHGVYFHLQTTAFLNVVALSIVM